MISSNLQIILDYITSKSVSWSLDVNEEAGYYKEVPKGREYVLRFYPHTPVGFIELKGPSVEDVLLQYVEFTREEHEAEEK